MVNRSRRVRLAAGSVICLVAVSGWVPTNTLIAASSRPAKVESRVVDLAPGPVGPGWSATVALPLPTDQVGFSWSGPPTASISVAPLGPGAASSSPWIAVDSDVDAGPGNDPARPGGTAGQDAVAAVGVATAGPVFVGHGVRLLAIRLTQGTVGRLRLHLIHSIRPASPAAGGVAARFGVLDAPIGSALGAGPVAADPAPPGIITRAEWGADESWRTLNPGCTATPIIATQFNNAIVHHTDNSNAYGPADSAGLVQGIYYFHTHVNGWCDIGYNFLVDRYGQVFEGRYGGITQPVVGAHAGGFNTGSVGVALIGEFQDTPVPAAMYASLVQLLAWRLAVGLVHPTAQTTVTAAPYLGSLYAAGAQVRLWTIAGHRDFDSTVCPGDFAYALLPTLRIDVQRVMAGAPPLLPTGALGLWLTASDGGVFALGGAAFYGSTGAMVLNRPVVGMAATADGRGYWLVASDGGIFSFGDARFYGSTGAMVLNRPVVGMAATADGRGYWLVASDGGIFSFGDARFYGSTGAMMLNRPIVGMRATADGNGYRFVASDGGVFAFGDAPYAGALAGTALTYPVAAIIPGEGTGASGYNLVDGAGELFGFGGAPFPGSLADLTLHQPIVGGSTT
jgi:hypothetical protein